MTDLLPSTNNPHLIQIPHILLEHRKKLLTDFSKTPEVNIINIFRELTPAKFRNLIRTKLGNDIFHSTKMKQKNT